MVWSCSPCLGSSRELVYVTNVQSADYVLRSSSFRSPKVGAIVTAKKYKSLNCSFKCLITCTATSNREEYHSMSSSFSLRSTVVRSSHLMQTKVHLIKYSFQEKRKIGHQIVNEQKWLTVLYTINKEESHQGVSFAAWHLKSLFTWQ